MERLFRGFKRGCRQKTGDPVVGRTLRSMLTDTPLVGHLRHPEYVKIWLNGQPNLERLFAQIEPATVRDELQKAQQTPEQLPRPVKRFISKLTTATPIKTFLENLKPNYISRS
jgi:hypothetical protein